MPPAWDEMRPAITVQKQHTVQELPSTSDQIRLKEYGEPKLEHLVHKLVADPAYSTWQELAEVVLSRLVVLNNLVSEFYEETLNHFSDT